MLSNILNLGGFHFKLFAFFYVWLSYFFFYSKLCTHIVSPPKKKFEVFLQTTIYILHSAFKRRNMFYLTSSQFYVLESCCMQLWVMMLSSLHSSINQLGFSFIHTSSLTDPYSPGKKKIKSPKCAALQSVASSVLLLAWARSRVPAPLGSVAALN